jgi:hypothetical protein
MEYHPKPEKARSREGVFVRSPDTITLGEENFRQIDNNAFEVIKHLRRLGINVTMADGMQTVKFDDDLVNCPVIECAGTDARRKYEACCAALLDFLEALRKKGRNFTFAVNFEVELETTMLSLSIAGTGADIVAWLRTRHWCLPEVEEKLAEWSETNRDWLTATYPAAKNNPDLSEALKRNGKLYLDRSFLDHQQYKFIKNDNSIDVEFAIPREVIQSEVEFLRQCRVAPCIFINRSSCSKCKEPYHSCLCSKWLEDDVVQVIERLAPVSCYFTWPRN